jgi:poly-gamma-glutamate capsule biosynthesis protein CapA/YwtB (metallophosphatase superfamily)
MHWGEEYQLEPTDYQKKIAQKLCDMGVDVIVGGHPHVIEPVDLLTSTQDENQKTLIIYSTGNAVSNQRIREMRMKTGHTEDGILFHFTLAKYIDGREQTHLDELRRYNDALIRMEESAQRTEDAIKQTVEALNRNTASMEQLAKLFAQEVHNDDD